MYFTPQILSLSDDTLFFIITLVAVITYLLVIYFCIVEKIKIIVNTSAEKIKQEQTQLINSYILEVTKQNLMTDSNKAATSYCSNDQSKSNMDSSDCCEDNRNDCHDGNSDTEEVIDWILEDI